MAQPLIERDQIGDINLTTDITDVDTTGINTDDILRYTGSGWVDTSLASLAGTELNLNDLADVDTTGVATDNILRFDGGDWVDTTLADLAGTELNIGDLQDVNVTASPGGANDGDSLTYDSGIWVPYAGNKARNEVINGWFHIWQRGISFDFSASVGGTKHWCADRWAYVHTSGSFGIPNISISRASHAHTDTFTDSTYYLSMSYNGLGADRTPELYHIIENVGTFRGRTITVSFWMFATGTAVGQTVGVELTQMFDTTLLQNLSNPTVSFGTFITTPGWTKHTFTGTLGTSGGPGVAFQTGLALVLEFPDTDSMGVPGTFNLADVVLQEGPYDLPAHRRRIHEELALCQRYYTKTYSHLIAPGTITPESEGLQYFTDAFTGGATFGTPGATFHYPVEMRNVPTITTYNPGTGLPGLGVSGIAGLGPWYAGTSIPPFDQLPASLISGSTRFVNITIDAAIPPSENYHVHAVADAELP